MVAMLRNKSELCYKAMLTEDASGELMVNIIELVVICPRCYELLIQ